jgi:hypothetical protein
VGVLNEYKAAHPAAPLALARRMDGALLAIGTLADVLKVGRQFLRCIELLGYVFGCVWG